MKVSLIIPIYNEANRVEQAVPTLNKLLARLRTQYAVEVVFVDDGSHDDTVSQLNTAFADDPQVGMITHTAHRGLGAALRSGFARATGDFIITTDFANNYPYNTIPQLLAHMRIYDVDIVTASPYHPRSAVKSLARLCNACRSIFYRLLVRWDIYTWNALVRAYRREVIDTVSFQSENLMANAELLIAAIDSGFRIAEYPTVPQANLPGSHTPQPTIATHLKHQLRLLGSRISGRSSGRQRTQHS